MNITPPTKVIITVIADASKSTCPIPRNPAIIITATLRTRRAGFVFNEYGAGNTGDASGQIDTLTSGAKLGSDYPDVPAGAGAAAGQFGNWLPNSMLPFGIFYDDDANFTKWQPVDMTGCTVMYQRDFTPNAVVEAVTGLNNG